MKSRDFNKELRPVEILTGQVKSEHGDGKTYIFLFCPETKKVIGPSWASVEAALMFCEFAQSEAGVDIRSLSETGLDILLRDYRRSRIEGWKTQIEIETSGQS